MDAKLKAEWERCKKVLSPEKWDAGQNATYFGFFCHGWYGRLNEAAYQTENNGDSQPTPEGGVFPPFSFLRTK